MTPQAQRIAIAEACGYALANYIDTYEGGSGRIRWKNPHGEWVGYSNDAARISHLPDYLSDLNAMHEAEKVLTDEQQIKARWVLVQLLDKWETWEFHEYETINVWEMSLHSINDCLNATAAQRAEAFLRTVGKWDDSK